MVGSTAEGGSAAFSVSARTQRLLLLPGLGPPLKAFRSDPPVSFRTEAAWVLLLKSSLRLVCQRSMDAMRCCSSRLSMRQRLCRTSLPRRAMSRPPQRTASIGEPVSRSALVTRVSPSSRTTAPQAASRGRLSSVASSGSSITVRPTSRARVPPRVASIGIEALTPFWAALYSRRLPTWRNW